MLNDLHVTGIWLKNFLTWKKRPLICTVFLFWLTLKLNVRHDRPFAKSMCFVRSIFTFVSSINYKTEESGMKQNIKIKMKIRVRGIRWEKRWIKQAQMKEKQCNLLFRALLCYFYITFSLIICLKLLFNVLIVQACKYGRKQVSRTVLWVLWCTSAITHEFLGAQPKIQLHIRPVSCNLWALQSVMLF